MDARPILFGLCLMLLAGSAAMAHYGHGIPIADAETGRPLGPLTIAYILTAAGGCGLLAVASGVRRRR